MIARIIFILIPLIVLPELYLDLHYLRHRTHLTVWKRLLWWLPSLVLLVMSVMLALERNFAPDNTSFLYWYLFLLGLITVPKAVFALCSFLGWRFCRRFHKRSNWGNLLGLALALFAIYVLVYGTVVGFRKLEVRHLELTFDDLPAAFDGYRIVQFSDIHVGTYTGSRQQILQRALDSINAQHADAICFTGDIQNVQPSELYPVMRMLSELKAKDGVYAILGNHDYSFYLRDADDAVKVANEREVVSRERQMGWRLLLNEHVAIERGNDRLVLAGMENAGDPPGPSRGDIAKTLHGVDSSSFVIMLEHEPIAWRREILPKSGAQLTLSGHTHGGQISFFGISPMRLLSYFKFKEYCGEYREGDRVLFVSKGLGGFIPLRFGATGEIVVITLRRK